MKNPVRMWAGCVVLGCCLLLTQTGFAETAAKSPYKFGVNLELTGPWANAARTLKMALEMEVDRLNAAGGIQGHPIELLIRDNGFDVAKVSTHILEFAREPSVLAVIGPFEDTFQAAARAIAEREGITNVIVCPSNPRVRVLNQRWSFNIAHNDIVVSQKLVDLCQARGYRTVLVFAGNWPLAQSLARQFESLGKEKGLRVIVSQETHSPADMDMTPQLIKMMPLIKTEGVDALYAATGGPPAPIICNNARTLGMEVPILGTHAFGFRFILELGGEAMDGVEFPTGKPVVPLQLDKNDPARSVILDFNDRMKARCGVPADQIAGHGYDIVWLLADALKRCEGGVTRERLRDALENTSEFTGCTGVFNYAPDDHDGLDKEDLVFVRIENGGFVRVHAAPSR